MLCWAAVETLVPAVAAEKRAEAAVAAEKVAVDEKMVRAVVEKEVPVVGGKADLADRSVGGKRLAEDNQCQRLAVDNPCRALRARLAEALTAGTADWAEIHDAAARKGADAGGMGIAYAAEGMEARGHHRRVRTVEEEMVDRKVEALVARNLPSAAAETASHLETLSVDLSLLVLESFPLGSFRAS